MGIRDPEADTECHDRDAGAGPAETRPLAAASQHDQEHEGRQEAKSSGTSRIERILAQ
jgi:hypothetical protein